MKKETRFRLVPFDEIAVGSEPVDLIQSFIPREGVTVIWGPPKEGKSFLVMDMMMSVARSRPYRGRRVQGGAVVYLCLEGSRGFRARIEALKLELRLDAGEARPAFHMIDSAFVMVEDANELIRSIEDQLAGERPAAIVIDTVNRSFCGSESNDQAMTAYLQAGERLSGALACAVIVVHHTGINESRMRGHTSLLGGAVASLSVKMGKKDRLITLTVEDMKDGERGEKIVSRLRPGVFIRNDEDGVPITSCVVEAVEQPGSTKALGAAKQNPLSGRDSSVAYAEAVRLSAEGSVTLQQWRAATMVAFGVRNGSAGRQAFSSVKRVLSDAGLLIIDGDRVSVSETSESVRTDGLERIGRLSAQGPFKGAVADADADSHASPMRAGSIS